MSNRDLAKRFEEIIQCVLGGEKQDAYEKDLSNLFEFIATRMLGNSASRKGHYFDGVVGLTATIKTSRQAEFQGEMWVGLGREQWTEPFKTIVTDNGITRQGIWIVIQVGVDRAEGEIMSNFEVTGEIEPQ
jgi:hypothetical protein